MTLRQTSIQAFYEHRESFNSKLLTHPRSFTSSPFGVPTSIPHRPHQKLQYAFSHSTTSPVSRCLLVQLVQHVQPIRRLTKARDSSVPRLRLLALACLVCQMSIP